MQSLFELKREEAFDLTVLERMKNTAASALQEAEKDQYTQAIVLYSSVGNEYCAVINNALSDEKNEEIALFERLNAVKDTKVCYVLCMWRDGGIDIPSHAFRKKLCSLHSQNADALLFVMTKNGVSAVKASATMK